MSLLPEAGYLIKKKSPLFAFSSISLEKSNASNLSFSLNFKSGDNLFDLFYNELFEETLTQIGILLNEIKSNNIDVLVKIDKIDSTIDDAIKFYPTRTEDNDFEIPIVIYLLKSKELDDYFDNIVNNSNKTFSIMKKSYSYNQEINKFTIDKMSCFLNEKVKEISGYDEVNQEIKSIIKKIKEEKNIDIDFYLNKNQYGYLLELSFDENKESLFECDNDEISFSEKNLQVFNKLYDQYFSETFRKSSEYKARKYNGNDKMIISNFKITIYNTKKSI